jgi:hypothetical protein
MLYSQSTGGFYLPELHGESIPSDAVEITDAEHAALIAGQSTGKRIVPDANGVPVLQTLPEPSANQLILNQIGGLEATVTPRRLREAVLGTDGGWLAGVNTQIAALRAKLVP